MCLTQILFGRERCLNRPSQDAKPVLIENADLVSEMVEVKYPCESVIKAQRRIVFQAWQLV
jgi:hypothetical protein